MIIPFLSLLTYFTRIHNKNWTLVVFSCIFYLHTKTVCERKHDYLHISTHIHYVWTKKVDRELNILVISCTIVKLLFIINVVTRECSPVSRQNTLLLFWSSRYCVYHTILLCGRNKHPEYQKYKRKQGM